MPDAMQQMESVQKCSSAVRKKWATVGRNWENIKENAMQAAWFQRHYTCLSPDDFRDSMKTPQAIVAPVAGQSKPNKERLSPNEPDLPTEKAKYLGAKIWQVETTVRHKPHFLVESNSVINTKSEFEHKLLCDGLTFTAGHACAFNCSFCYVGSMMRKNGNLNGVIKKLGTTHEGVVVDIANPLKGMRKALMQGSQPRYADPKDNRVIYGSPLVDVCGTKAQTEVTIKICREILNLTNWQIRLLSKSAALKMVAKAFSKEEYKQRMIFGLSTGTLDEKVAGTFEIGPSSVSSRLRALKELQDEGYRTFGMLCPILPQADYDRFADEVAAHINIKRCEHVWAEVLNSRGESMNATIAALNKGGCKTQAALLEQVVRTGAGWDEYAQKTFLALTKVIPPEKLRFLQYVKPADYPFWDKQRNKGAVLLGKHAKMLAQIDGKDVTKFEPLEPDERELLKKCESVIRENLEQFKDVCLALYRIKKSRLYRESHTSFEAYCAARFDFGLAHGKRLASAGEVIQELEDEQKKMAPNGAVLLPTSEAQARELAQLDRVDRLRVLKEAVTKAGKKRVTAVLIQHTAAELVPSAQPAPYPALPKYVTDLRVFLDWLADLKKLTKTGQTEKVVGLLEKAEREQSIQREMPADAILFVPQSHEFGWMSNPSDYLVEHKGKLLNTEAMFQWFRFEGHAEIQEQLVAKPADAKTLAKEFRHLLVNPESQDEIELMRQCLRMKLEQHPALVKKLLATGERTLVADFSTAPKDEALFWGMALVDGQWVGQNWLGKVWMALRAEKPKLNQAKLNEQVKLAQDRPQDRIRIYGKNKETPSDPEQESYWTEIDKWIGERRSVSRREPFYVNVTSNGSVDEFDFRKLSPMLMGPVTCYSENGETVVARSVEVAWQYSKVYSWVINKSGKRVDRTKQFITKDEKGNPKPSKRWFRWRDAAYHNPQFEPDAPELELNKERVRSAYTKSATAGRSEVAFWYWDGEVIFNPAEARKRIYSKLYVEFVRKTEAFQKLREIFEGSADEPGRDVKLYDYDGYDWQGLGKSPEDCLHDTGHSFGHGVVISFLLLGINPAELPVKTLPLPIPESDVKHNVDWAKCYDSYNWGKGKQKPMSATAKAKLENFAASVLGINPDDTKKCWGTAYPPGCFAATVIRVHDGIRHRFEKKGSPVCIKIYNRELGVTQWKRIHTFHTQYRDKMPGLPANQVQNVLEVGPRELVNGDRPYLVQEWIEGQTLEALVEGGSKVGVDDALNILDSLFLKLVIPAWSKGSKWWDARHSNYIYTPDKRVVMIDPDVLGDYGREIATTPETFEKRNTCNPNVAMSRYQTFIADLALACIGNPASKGIKPQVKKISLKHLVPTFCAKYPLPVRWNEKATAAYQAFRVEYEQMLNSAGQPLKSASRRKLAGKTMNGYAG